MNSLLNIVREQKQGKAKGIYSCCSANSYVIKAVLYRALLYNQEVLIEATANQVNQFGGYTGMKPKDFYEFVHSLAKEMKFPSERIILGGDHLGPLTWTNLPETQAMKNAEELIRQYILAGFTKIHLDTSMRIADDSLDVPLSDEVIARRGARLCKVAEESYTQLKLEKPDAIPPVYSIGSEVPIPGGAQEVETEFHVTDKSDCLNTYREFEKAFRNEQLSDAWQRIIGIVVQPGVEFGDNEIIEYNREKAGELVSVLQSLPVVFEGHSTDYQPQKLLREMVKDGIAILKVGPALTFAFREALFSLESIEKERFIGSGKALSDFRAVLEHAMLENPNDWERHYHGNGNDTKFARAFSLSDRARYYLPHMHVQQSLERLLDNLSEGKIPLALISQYMPLQYASVREGKIINTPEMLILDRIGNCIDDYLYATNAM